MLQIFPTIINDFDEYKVSININTEKNFAVIMANGCFPPSNILKNILKNCNFTVCADGGANKAKELNIKPNIIIGDLDSIDQKTFDYYNDTEVSFIQKSSQNINDLEKAIIYLIETGHKKIILTGVTGGRDDHSYTVYQLLKKFNSKATITVFSETSEFFILKSGNHKISSKKNQTISMFPYPVAENICTEGLKFLLNNETLEEGSRGVSNEALGKNIMIKIENGNLLIFKNMSL